MVQGYCQEGLLEESYRKFTQREENNCLPNNVTYNILICGCFQNKKYDGGCVLIDEMCAHGFCLQATRLAKIKEAGPRDP